MNEPKAPILAHLHEVRKAGLNILCGIRGCFNDASFRVEVCETPDVRVVSYLCSSHFRSFVRTAGD